MQLKTSSALFEKYGSVYDAPLELNEPEMLSRTWHVIAKRSVSQLYHFNCEVYLEMEDGMAALLVGETPETDKL